MENQICPSCGTPLASGSSFCGNCGQQLTQQPAVPPISVQPQPYRQAAPDGYQQPYYQEPQQNNKTMIYVLVVVIAVLVLALIGGGIWYMNSKKEAKEAKEAEAIRIEKERQEAQIDSLTEIAKAAQAEANKAKEAAQKAEKTSRSSRFSSVPPSQATRVVINGSGVRMRTGPGKQYPFPTTWDGHAYTVAKGTSLPFLGDYGGWYAVQFEGGTYYVSADYAYLR